MKKNMARAMKRLDIDRGIQKLISFMWRHNYRTTFSCDGHGNNAYVSFIEGSGDGWFERNASKYGLQRRQPCLWCEHEVDNFCGQCGAGRQGNIVYDGRLKNL